MKESGFRKSVIFLIVVILIISVGLDFYFVKDNENKILELKESYENELKSLKEKYDTEINSIIEKVGLTEEEIKGIEKKVEEAEEKSSELEEEIKGISIEAGDFSAIVEDVIKGVVTIITDKGQASGTIVSEDGYIVTNYHTVDGISAMSIFLHDGSQKAGSLIGFDEVNDVAVLKIDENNLHDLDFTNSDKVKIGESVIALGNPGGLDFTVTEGIISQKDRIVKVSMVGLLQTDVAVNPGNSGGPLLNKEGNIVGIVNSKIVGFEGLGFAIPSNFVLPKIEEIIGEEI